MPGDAARDVGGCVARTCEEAEREREAFRIGQVRGRALRPRRRGRGCIGRCRSVRRTARNVACTARARTEPSCGRPGCRRPAPAAAHPAAGRRRSGGRRQSGGGPEPLRRCGLRRDQRDLRARLGAAALGRQRRAIRDLRRSRAAAARASPAARSRRRSHIARDPRGARASRFPGGAGRAGDPHLAEARRTRDALGGAACARRDRPARARRVTGYRSAARRRILRAAHRRGGRDAHGAAAGTARQRGCQTRASRGCASTCPC